MKEIPAEHATSWAKYFAAQLGSLNDHDLHFIVRSWSTPPPADALFKIVNAFWIDRGAFKNVGVITLEWPASSAAWSGAQVTALLGLDGTLRPESVLQALGGWEATQTQGNLPGDLTGIIELRFLTLQSLVFEFRGLAGEWPILIERTEPGQTTVREMR